MPVVVDVRAENWNLDVDQLERAIGPKTVAIIATHLHGGMVPMKRVMEIARARALAVVEDAAQAPGAMVDGRKAGSWGDIGVLSFGGSKLLSAGRGGALLLHQAADHQRARLWLSRGIQQWAALSEMQAAVLLPQLAKLDGCNARRLNNVALLRSLISGIPRLRLFSNSMPNSSPGYYKVGMQYDADAVGLSRERFVAAVRAEGVALDEGFRALHIGRAPGRFRAAGDLIEAENAHRGVVMLHHPILLGEACDIEQVASAIRKTYRNADRLRG
jgi:perosamine synthetase